MKILLLNAGSSSLKCSLVESNDGSELAHGLVDWAGSKTRYCYAGPDGTQRNDDVNWKGHGEAVRRFVFDLSHVEPLALSDQSELAAVGHRIVHGGEFTSSVRISSDVRSRITTLADLAPLHNPPSLETLVAAEAELPSVPHVAVFDTAFHATLPLAAHTYPVPEQWTQQWSIRRFGFHGLSHAYCARRAAEMVAPFGRRFALGHWSSGPRLFRLGSARWSLCRHDDGVHTLGWTDDGNAQRLDRSGDCLTRPATSWLDLGSG